MPNWVRNDVIVREKHADAFSKAVKGEKLNFDFNAVIPMSKDLEITAGVYIWKECESFVGRMYNSKTAQVQNETIKPLLDYYYNDVISQAEFLEKLKSSDDWKELCQRINSLFGREDIEENDIANYIKSYYNVRRYGNPTWYEWACDNWGTKWNISEVYTDQTDCYSFDTAWSTPIKVYEKLALKFDFIVMYADEDYGSNFGVLKAKDGELVRLELGLKSSYSKFAFASMVWSDSYEDLVYYTPEGEEKEVPKEAVDEAVKVYSKYAVHYYAD